MQDVLHYMIDQKGETTMMWLLFFAITLGLAVVAAHEQCNAEDSAANVRMAREYSR